MEPLLATQRQPCSESEKMNYLSDDSEFHTHLQISKSMDWGHREAKQISSKLGALPKLPEKYDFFKKMHWGV